MAGGNGITPLIWGPLQWQLLHMIASTYPENPTDIDKQNYYNYFLALGNVLPCQFCKHHFKQTLIAMNFNMGVFENQETLFRFVFDLHNTVNERLKKPIMDDYAYFRRRYDLYKQM